MVSRSRVCIVDETECTSWRAGTPILLPVRERAPSPTPSDDSVESESSAASVRPRQKFSCGRWS